MRDEDKPFICYRRGWSMNIKPRNVEGWRQFGLWLAALVPIVVLFIWVMSLRSSPALTAVYVLSYVAAMLAWAFNMIRWMLARSQVIDLTGKR
ncbi:hypothetical protein OKA06_02525 [Novosphingobium sp. MW5]|nr:hypothetical protein [Novosphingobium sp. MW5]